MPNHAEHVYPCMVQGMRQGIKANDTRNKAGDGNCPHKFRGSLVVYYLAIVKKTESDDGINGHLVEHTTGVACMHDY